MTKIGPLSVNAEAIGDGIYAMICERGEEAIVAFGMIPKWSIDVLERQLRQKVLEIAAQQNACSVTELQEHRWLSEARLQEVCRPVVKAVCSAIYASAARAGKMVV